MSEAHFALRQELKDEAKRELRLARIEELENRVYEQSAQVVEALLQFHMVSPNQTEPPPEWVAEYGERAAKQKLEVAKAGWLPQSMSPAAVGHAVKIVTAISRHRRHQLKLSAREVNVRIALPAPTSREHPGPIEYEVRDLET